MTYFLSIQLPGRDASVSIFPARDLHRQPVWPADNRRQSRIQHGRGRSSRIRRFAAFDTALSRNPFGRARLPDEIAALIRRPNLTTPVARSRHPAHARLVRRAQAVHHDLLSIASET